MSKNFHLDKWYSNEFPSFDGISLIQIGRMYCDRDSHIAEHIQGQLIELTVITDGKGTVFSNGIPTPVKQGDIYLSLPCDSHEITVDPNDPLKFDFLAISVENDELKEDFERAATIYHSSELRLFSEERIPPLLSEAITEINSESRYSNKILSAILHQIAIYTLRAFSGTPRNKALKNLTDSEILCHQLMNYIDTHIYSLKNLEELTEVVGYSYGYLSATFKKTTGETLNSYYLRKRMDAARLMLLEGKLKATDIAERLGYSTLYAFSKAFKGYFGISPKNFKNK